MSLRQLTSNLNSEAVQLECDIIFSREVYLGVEGFVCEWTFGGQRTAGPRPHDTMYLSAAAQYSFEPTSLMQHGSYWIFTLTQITRNIDVAES